MARDQSSPELVSIFNILSTDRALREASVEALTWSAFQNNITLSESEKERFLLTLGPIIPGVNATCVGKACPPKVWPGPQPDPRPGSRDAALLATFETFKKQREVFELATRALAWAEAMSGVAPLVSEERKLFKVGFVSKNGTSPALSCVDKGCTDNADGTG